MSSINKSTKHVQSTKKPVQSTNSLCKLPTPRESSDVAKQKIAERGVFTILNPKERAEIKDSENQSVPELNFF